MTGPEEHKEGREPQDEDEEKAMGGSPPESEEPEGGADPESLDPEPVSEEPVAPRNLEEREVHVVGVFEQSDGTTTLGNPFVLLRDNRGRCVMIWIGRFEAFAISTGLENVAAERPLTHDLLRNVTERLGGSIDRIVVDDLWGETFYAKVWVNQNGHSLSIDARPSDAIALGVRVKCPVFMVEAVLDEAGRPCEDFEPPEG